jgi:hypothetical protein
MRNLGTGTYVTCCIIIFNNFSHLWLPEIMPNKLIVLLKPKCTATGKS